MRDRSNPFLAPEGIPFIAAAGIVVIVFWSLLGLTFSIIPILVLIWLYLIFRDPMRESPAAPLGVLSPVDGVIVEVSRTNQGLLHPEAHKIIIEINSLGTYTARCPAEGKIMDIRVSRKDGRAAPSENGLWVQTDEGDDVVLQFNGHRFNVAPRAFLGYGDSSFFCLQNLPENWVLNNNDNEPLCSTNDTDYCGICAGGAADDLGCGCFNPAALEYWYDSDGDGFGYGDSQLFCLEAVAKSTACMVLTMPHVSGALCWHMRTLVLPRLGLERGALLSRPVLRR